SVITIIVIAAANILGTRIGANLLKVLTILKVSTLVFIVLFGFLGGYGNFRNFSPFFAAPNNLFDALAGGLIGAFFAFAGWWEVSRLTGEIREPERNLPRALAIGVILLTIIYVSTSAVFMYLVAPANVANDQTFAAQAGEAMFGAFAGKIFAAVVVISALGTPAAYLM